MVAAPPALDVDLLCLQHDGRYVQDDFFCCQAPYVYFKAGRACGKTTTLVLDAVTYAQEWPGSVQLFTEPGWAMVERVALPILHKLYGRLRGQGIDWNESPPIDIRVGSSLIWLSAADTIDENRARGMNLARALMDEAAQGQQEAAFHLISGCVRDTGRPNQRKVTSTPMGRNWLWQMFSGEPLPGARQFIAYSEDAERAGFVPPGWVEERALEYGGWANPLARQELMAQELEMAGQVFPQFRRDVHVRTYDYRPTDGQGDSAGRTHRVASEDAYERPQRGESLKQRLGGIDFGGVSPTALVAGGLDAGGRAWAFGEWYRHQATMDQLIEAMAEGQRSWGVTRWIADPAGKQEIEKLRHAGFKVSPANHGNKLKLRVGLVGARLNVHPSSKLPGMYVTPECPNLIAELEGLAWRRVRLSGASDEMMADEFDRRSSDHAFDAWANVLAEWDLVRQAPVRSAGPVSVYG